jgi:hypothetical protein
LSSIPFDSHAARFCPAAHAETDGAEFVIRVGDGRFLLREVLIGVP